MDCEAADAIGEAARASDISVSNLADFVMEPLRRLKRDLTQV